MEISVGLPAMVPGTGPDQVVGWARAAEEYGFAGVAALDRVVFGNYEPMVTLAMVAGATTRVRLATTVLLGPLRGNGTLLAKQAATLHLLTGGRLMLGVAVGGREDDYTATGAPFAERGRDLDEMLARMRGVWRGAARVGPELSGDGPPIIVGGHSPAALRRAALHADGWIAGAGSAEPYEARVRRLTAAWRAAGRTDRPRLMALVYYALGPGADDQVSAYVDACYGGLGPYAGRVASGAVTTAAQVAAVVDRHAEAGCDELVFFPCAAGADQLERLAGLVEPTARTATTATTVTATTATSATTAAATATTAATSATSANSAVSVGRSR
ncbi:LLM class flavin-dependent oxidoreductase [Nonomuraea sp. NPDC049129]|uniref:LLM class flavin-dependent oxidoreductase n=1 Tax=Nonomuraea sp. NPDC049129 TaxID=3155272 RepID=UPI0033F4252D